MERKSVSLDIIKLNYNKMVQAQLNDFNKLCDSYEATIKQQAQKIAELEEKK